MKVPNEYIEEIANENYKDNLIEKINEKLYLNKKEQNTLNEYGINYQDCKSISELICVLQNEGIDEEEIDELLAILDERNYYYNVNK